MAKPIFKFTVKVGIAIFILYCLFGIGFFIYDAKTQNSSFTAQFADNVLRPILGSKRTVWLERVLFNTQDKLHQNLQNLANPSLTRVPVTSFVDWQPVIYDDQKRPSTILEAALFYPDSTRSYAFVHLVRLDMSRLSLGAVAGTKEPAGEIGRPGPGIVPDDLRQNGSLLAAFNGGFQYRDGKYGMIVDNQVYLPLEDGLASLLVDKKTGKVSITEYHQGQLDTGKYSVIRQNGPLLVKDGKVIPSSSDKLAKVWGRSVTASMYTWRSGVGITQDGSLIYAVGPSLIPETLGEALAKAGAVNAMQLDINPFWVRFSVFKSAGNGSYKHESLFRNMYDGGKDFLTGYKKDFFYVYLKNRQANYLYCQQGCRL